MAQKILIIDDEKDLRTALNVALTKAGYEVHEAIDGVTGLEAARALAPDLILLDITMPHLNGHQVLKELRLHPSKKKTPVLLLTNSDDATNITRGVTLKSDDYIIKSQTSLSEIVRKVQQHIVGYN